MLILLSFNIFDGMQKWIDDGLKAALDNNLKQIIEVVSNPPQLKEGLLKGVKLFNPEITKYMEQVNTMLIVPLAMLVFSFVILMKFYELLNAKNTNWQIETKHYIRVVIEGAIGYWFIRNSFTWVMASLEIGQWLNGKLSNFSNFTLSTSQLLNNVKLEDLGLAWALSFLVLGILKVLSFAMPLMLFALYLEIYVYIGLAALPMSTLMEEKWSNIGVNYIKNIFALSLAGFLMLLILNITGPAIQGILNKASGTTDALISIAIAQVFIFMLFMRSKTIAKSVLGAT